MKVPVIAIIEDSTIIREVVTRVMETQLKARVVTFDSAESAIREMDVYEPNVILLDYNLDSVSANNMNGMQFVKKLNLVGKSIPIIMMSGQRDKRVTADVLREGVVNYLAKDDDNFLENIVTEVQCVLDVLKLNKQQKKQQKDINKRIVRVVSLILVPILIVLACLYFQS